MVATVVMEGGELGRKGEGGYNGGYGRALSFFIFC